MKIGDVSRTRRWADPARRRWYAYHRAVRFARRMSLGPGRSAPKIEAHAACPST